MNGKQLKNSILQWAIQGKLVPQDPNDEPASLLLERIRAEKERLIKEKKIKRSKNESIIYRGEDNSYYEKFEDGSVKCIDDEIPFEIPVSWEWSRLGSLFIHTSGKQQSSNNKTGSPQQFITTSNLYWGYFILDNVKIMNFTEDEIKSCSATKGDLLVCEGGAGYGRSAIWDKDYDICLQNHVHRLRPYINGLCEYVYYLIYLLKESNNLVSVGTAMPGLSANRLKGLLVPLPPLKEQKRIVDRLQQLMPFVEKYNYAQDSLDALNLSIKEKLRKSILQDAIQGKLVSQAPNDEPASVLLEHIRIEKERLIKEKRIKRDKNESIIYKGDDNSYYEIVSGKTLCINDEIPFEIPFNWAWSRISSVINLLSGRDLEPSRYNSNSVGIPYITGASNLTNGLLVINRWTDTPATISHKGDLLITCKGTIGEMAYNQFGNIHIARQVMAIKSYLIVIEYLHAFLSLSVNELEAKANSMIPGISRTTILDCLLPIPPLQEQILIVERLQLLLDKLK